MLTLEADVPLSPMTLLSRSGPKPRVRVLTDPRYPQQASILCLLCARLHAAARPHSFLSSRLPCAEHDVDYDKITWREANLLSAPTGLAAGRDKDVRIAACEKLCWRTVEGKRI